MGKIIQTNIRIGRVQCNREDDYVSLELEDETSGICYATIKLSMEKFGQLIAGAGGRVKVEAELRGLNNIGKKYEYKKGSAFITERDFNAVTENVKYEERQKPLVQWLNANHSLEGWFIAPYLGSRDSIQYADGGKVLNFNYYRYVEIQ